MAGGKEDWAELLERLEKHDRAALARIARLVTGRLARLGAYDLRDDWDDIVQEVVVAVMGAWRERTITSSPQVQKFIWTTTWHKYRHVIDEAWRRRRVDVAGGRDEGEERDVGEDLSGPLSASARADGDPPGDGETLLGLAQLVDRIRDEETRALFLGHVLEGKSFDELAEETGLGRATVVRRVRAGREVLRAAWLEDEPP